jgi:PAS domain S-box-containing protein
MAERGARQVNERFAWGARFLRPQREIDERLADLLRELEQNRGNLGEQFEQLRQSKHHFASVRDRFCELYELAPVGYLTLDGEGRIERANLAARSFFDAEARSLIGSSFPERLAADDVENFRYAFGQLTRTQGTHPSLSVTIANEVRLPIRVRLVLSRAGASVLVTLRDFGEARTRTLGLALNEREAELRAIWSAVADAIVVVDERRLIVACNPAAARLFQHRREQVLGTHIHRFMPAFPGGPTEQRVELELQTAEGQAVAVEVMVSALRAGSSPLVAVITDVSERRREQAERNEALLRFNEIAEHVADAFFVAEADTGESLYVSAAFEPIYDRPLVQHRAEPWPRLDWVHVEDRFAVTEAADAARDGIPFDLEYRIVWPSGEVRSVHERARLIEGGRIAGIVRDITRERALADELKKSQRLEAMGTLASGVAHDFNNLLMGVGGCVQLALRRLDPADPAASYLRRATDAILRGANLTKQILRIGDTRRLSDGQVVIDDVLFGARELVESLAGDAISIAIVGQAPEVRVVAEAGDIEQILVNLVTNARDAMPSGGEIVLATEIVESEDEEEVTLSVRDTGVGMSPAVKARVFEPFFTTKRVGKGTGLGLATVFALARRLGGGVGLESTEGAGTMVSVTLPIAKRSSHLPSPDSYVPRSGGETVLLVDDDPLVRLTVENHLAVLGYRALVASNAEEAIGICEDQTLTIDLMITDVMMPAMLGPELSRVIRERKKQFPVLFMSAHRRDDLIADGRLDADARLLNKPFDANALGEALAAALEDARRKPVGKQRRLLVIDDDADLTDALRELLELEHFEVKTANDAERALAVAREFRPEIVLCDVELGMGGSGYDFASALRRDATFAETSLIALTGHEPSECRADAREAGFARVLGKPIDIAKLRHVLANTDA